MILGRRQLFKTAGLTLGAGLLPRVVWAREGEDPHYFLEVVVSGGWDPSYVFDARPQDMTDAGRIQNYLGGERQLLVGTNGGKALVTSLFEPLRTFFDAGQLAILNGVIMAAGFDGHEQNMNYLFAGNPFGGQSFIPYMNQGLAANPIDFLQIGSLYGTDLDNIGNSVSLQPRSAPGLTNAARATGSLDAAAPLQRYLSGRMAALGLGVGRVGAGVRSMASGLAKAPDLNDRLRQVELDLPQGEYPLLSTLKLLDQYFRRGLTRNAVIELEQYDIDAHDVVTAKSQPQTYSQIVGDLGLILKFLSETMVGEKSLLDLTTVVVTSEFTRTMRQENVAIDNTGTDHNPLTNTVLLAGKAVRGGQVIGASDQDRLDAPLSGAHLVLDAQRLKVMGQPFDFDTMQPSGTLPATYEPDDYLNFASVANTIMTLFGVPDDKLWAIKRNGPAARRLDSSVISRG